MTIVDITYHQHGACGCAYYAQHTAPEVPIIRGIDAGEILDRILAMRRQEDSDAYRIDDYLSSSIPSVVRAEERDEEILVHHVDVDVDSDCRAKMCQWFFQLADFCRVDRDNVAIAMSYLDRFLATAHSGNVRARRCLADRQEYQLAAMTCLYLAINLTETKEMDTGLLVELSHGKYAKADFVAMEEAITFGLGWRLNGPTTMGFVNHLLGLLPAEDASKYVHDQQPQCCLQALKSRDEAGLHELCRMQAELAVSDYRLVATRPSDVAVAAVRNAMEQSRPGDLLTFLRSLSVADIELFSPEVERARAVLKSAFVSNVDGLRQVTSLLKLGDDAAAEDQHHSVSAMRQSSLRESARCVGEVDRIQDQDKRRHIGEGATP